VTCPFTDKPCPYADLCCARFDPDYGKMEWKHDDRDWEDGRNYVHLIGYTI
jgi:hypothetical protein